MTRPGNDSRTMVTSLITGLSALILLLTAFPPPAAAAAGPTVVPLTTFSVASSQCAGGVQSQLVQNTQWSLPALLGPKNSLPVPLVSLNPGCSAPPSSLSAVVNASNTVSSSPSGSASLTSTALGNALLTERAYGQVELTASVPLNSPASSVEVSIPYTTTGVTWSPGNSSASVAIVPANTPTLCADGSYGSMAPYDQTGVIIVTSLGSPTPAGSGTYNGLRFYCPDGSKLVSGVGFTVSVGTYVYAANGQTESAAADFRMHDVIATLNP